MMSSRSGSEVGWLVQGQDWREGNANIRGSDSNMATIKRQRHIGRAYQELWFYKPGTL